VNGQLYAIDPYYGKLEWTQSIGNKAYSPFVYNDMIYAGSYDGNLVALDAPTGSLMWKFKADGAITSKPVADDKNVYVGCSDGYVYAVNTATGNLSWKYLTDGAIKGSPLLSNGVLYVGSGDSYVYALDAQAGLLYWKFQTSTPVDSTPVIASDDSSKMFFCTRDGMVYGLKLPKTLVMSTPVPSPTPIPTPTPTPTPVVTTVMLPTTMPAPSSTSWCPLPGMLGFAAIGVLFVATRKR
jgi:eukaryotic-like serine/threonine-protein kinase